MLRALLGTAKAHRGIAVAAGLGLFFAGTVAVEASGVAGSVLDVVGVETSSQDSGTAVCHRPPGNPARGRTIAVAGEGLSEHLAHGDALGECADAVTPVEASPANHVPEGKVAICHAPPGNPANLRMIVVGEETAVGHLEHDDAEGPCAESLSERGRGRPDHAGRRRAESGGESATGKIGICHNGRSMAVPSESLADHLGHGDAVDACGQQAQLN